MGEWMHALSAGRAVAVILDRDRPPAIHALDHVPERALQLDDEEFNDAGLGDFIGFYDWLRSREGRVIGVCLWPLLDEKSADLQAFDQCANVESAHDGAQLSIYFGDERIFDLAESGDQDFGDNRLFVGSSRHVLTFNAPGEFLHRERPRNAAAFRWRSDDVFARIASRYDLLCDLFSFGIHRLWKRDVARVIAAESWQTLLDGATGTGDIILRVLRHEHVQGRTVVASDISTAMLAIAERRLASHRSQVELKQLDMEAMPSVADGSVDAYSISLGLKICDRERALREALRVLRPGGRLIILEASRLHWRALQFAYLLYMSICMPMLGWLATGGDASAYRYLLQGIKGFPGALALCNELAQAGFADVSFERRTLGIVAIHTARKPLSPAP
ncbi:MAG: ubiquinone/menaquinone biosynthesis methyltransferase [Burkholderiales bacterium]|jgi:demethylmenaquinone methyltransferase/2-methoxy-6-polyprenyl-1,4-benzoquinol methylase|nr:ubiquinone/menaquinone biosynthesis methyltransferase [Burkholderiales bacterium]MBW8893700.1 ubiquinone/menaquinone biosynthesis methyltransferase [Burkholderiales bacterium]